MTRKITRSTAAALWRRLVAALMASALLWFVAMPDASAATYVPISGAGSTWSQNAVAQWASNVRQLYGMTVNFQGTGSSDGRRQFYNNTVDFAVSEIPYGLTDGGVTDPPPTRQFAYMPIVAGGTSFMYNLKINGKQVTQLRLSGDNVAKIFTGQLKLWNDPAIAAENPGLKLPARAIIPVVRSDGSGTTAQFTAWLAKKYPTAWDAYCKRAGRSTTPCGQTSNFPLDPANRFISQAGSVGVAGYVAQKTSEGAITYVEYSYALNANLPVVKVLNKAGYYTLPTDKNVAVGLGGARINADLTQVLDGVYDNADPRAYPLSSYSYMIVPLQEVGSFTKTKGSTLGAFAYYFLCTGQQSAGRLGYSPLPINLVEAGFDVVRKIPGVVASDINIKTCNNPTFSADGSNTLAKTAPQPQACDKTGTAQCDTTATTTTAGTTTGGTTTGGTTTTTGQKTTTGGVAAGGAGAAGGAPAPAPGVPAPAGLPAGAGAQAAGGTQPNPAGGQPVAGQPAAGQPAAGQPAVGQPAAGQPVAGSDGAAAVDAGNGQVLAAGAAAGGAANVAAAPVSLNASYTGGGVRTVLMVLAGLVLLTTLLGPPLIARRAARGGRS